MDGLRSNRVVNRLVGHDRVDVVIVGGGIAGVATAFEILENSDMSVMIIEVDRIAHGASGNGSGQVTPSFEQGFQTLSERFGPDMTRSAFRQIATAKKRFGELVKAAGAADKVHRVSAYIGFSSIDMAEAIGKASSDGASFVPPSMKMYVAAGSGWNCQLKDQGVEVSRVPPVYIRKLLGITDETYRAAAVIRTSIANIPLICEGLVHRMIDSYPHRFSIHEGTKVLSVDSHHPLLVKCEEGDVECKRVVMCTNGYDLPDISSIANSFPDDYLKGITGYMNGYRPPFSGERAGIFFHEVQPSKDEPYIFSTVWGKDKKSAMLMIGGPQNDIGDVDLRNSMDERAHARIDNLAKEIFGIATKEDQCWDGRMGYTSSGVRLAGPDPVNPNIYYNLGCNGIGILHSVYGARRIAAAMAGKRMADSVFDPRRQFTGP